MRKLAICGDEIWVMVDLNATPWVVGPLTTARGKGGKMFPKVGRDQQLYAYQQAVKEEVEAAFRYHEIGSAAVYYLQDGVLKSPLYPAGTKLDFVVYVWRSMIEYKSHQARAARNQEADATNMLKATEDALHDVFYKNDKDNSSVRCVIVEQAPDVVPRLVIRIKPHNPNAWADELPQSFVRQIIVDDQMGLFE